MNQLLQKYNVEEDPTDPAPPPLSYSLSLFSRLQLELTRTRTRTRWTRGILSTWINNWNPSFDSVEEVCSSRARVPAYIAHPNERGPSYHTDLNRTVFFDPQRRWSTIHRSYPDWLLGILNANRKIRKRTDTDVERECTNYDPRSPKDNYIIIFGGKGGSFLRVL